jgi:SAM-dependent methyltransferase
MISAQDDGLSPQPIMELAAAFQRSRVLLTAWELDVFTVLAEEPRTSDEVAAAIGTDTRATDRLMNALCALGLLEKRARQFANSPLAARFLVKGRPDYAAGLGHTNNLWTTWSTLTDVVRTGASRPRPGVSKRGEEWVKPFIAAMHWRARRSAPAVIGLLDLAGVARVLDVGGGSGAFAMAFVRARSGISAVVFDLPAVVPLSRNYIQTEGFTTEIEAVAGDYLGDELPGGFDLVFLSAVVHSNSAVQNERLIGKAVRALHDGGQVVVQDWLMSEDRTSPAAGAFFALNMLVGTEAGDTFTEAEVRGWMQKAGLTSLERKDVPGGGGLLIGRKP